MFEVADSLVTNDVLPTEASVPSLWRTDQCTMFIDQLWHCTVSN